MTRHIPAYPIRPVLFTAGLVMLIVIGLGVARTFDLIEGDMVKRGGGMAFGALLVMLGNFLPKVARPAGETGDAGARVMFGERLAGWIFVLAGIGYMVAWMISPLAEGTLIASLIGLGAFGIALIVWLQASHGASLSTPVPPSVLSARYIMFHMLHAVFWCIAMFMAANLWGKEVVAWLAAGFAMANGWLGVCLTRPKSRPEA